MSAAAGPSNWAATMGDSDSITSASSGSSQATALASRGDVGGDRNTAMYSNKTTRSTETLKPAAGATSAPLTALTPSDTTDGTPRGVTEDADLSGQSPSRRIRRLSTSSVSPTNADAANSSSRSRHVSWHPTSDQPLATDDDRTQAEHQLVDIVALGASLQPGIELEGEAVASASAWEEGRATSEISRTPSQSTTGTNKTLSSLDTAASSLQSSSALHDGKRDDTCADESVSPGQACNVLETVARSPHLRDNAEEKRDMNTLRRYLALQELVQSESEYVEDLDILVNIFFQNLGQQSFFAGNPRRLAAVRRNGTELLEIHQKLAADVVYVMDDCGISEDSGRSAMDRAQHSDEAIIRVAQVLADAAPQLTAYHQFCSMQAEAEQVLSEARSHHNGNDFVAFERYCNSLLRSTPRAVTSRTAPSSRRTSMSTAPSYFPGLTQLVNDAEPAEFNFASTANLASPLSSPPASGATTPSGSVSSFSSTVRQAQILRLRFNDYHIKPVQRLCRYSLFLNAIIQFTPLEDVITRSALHKAIDRLDDVSTAVDQASLRRQKEVVGETLFKRLERPAELSDKFLGSLGAPELIGVADILHHHPTLNPLRAPFRFCRAGIVLWANFLVFVRVRKNKRLVCQSYFPLHGAVLGQLHPEAASSSRSPRSDTTRDNNAAASSLRNNFRLSYGNHSFELSARSERERNLWYSALEMAISKTAEGDPPPFPNSFAEARDGHHLSGGAQLEPLHDIAKNMLRSTATGARESNVKFQSASLCAHFDRLMTFSEVFRESTAAIGFAIGTTGTSDGKDIYEAVAAQQARQTPGPSISSTVVGLAKMATTQVPNAIRSRRSSSARQLDVQSGARLPNVAGARGLYDSASSSSTIAVVKPELNGKTPDETPSNTSTERLGNKIRNSIRRHSTLMTPKRASTTPALTMSNSGEETSAEDLQAMDMSTSTSGLSPYGLQVETNTGVSRSSPHLTPGSDGSSPGTVPSSGSDDRASPSFMTPSEEVGGMNLPLVQSPSVLERAALIEETGETQDALPSVGPVQTDRQDAAFVTRRRSSLTASSTTESATTEKAIERQSVSAAASPVQFTSPFRENAARTLRRARSGAWNRLSTFGAPVMMGPTSSTSTLVSQSSPSRGKLARASTDISPGTRSPANELAMLEAPSRTSVEQTPGSGNASCSSSTHSVSSSRASLARLRGTLARSLSLRGKSQPAPAMASTGEPIVLFGQGISSGLGLSNMSEPSFRAHSRRASVAESPLLTDSAVKLVSETTRDTAVQTDRVDVIPEASFDSVTPAGLREPTPQ